MRIKSIEVIGLFGTFDHRIPFHLEDGITIIHGPNGLGKTILLRLIDTIFSVRNQLLFKIPFDRIVVEFDTGKALAISKNDLELPLDTVSRKPDLLTFTYDGEVHNLRMSRSLTDIPLGQLVRIIPELERVGESHWLSRRSGRVLSLDEVVEEYADRLPGVQEIVPEWLRKLRAAVKVKLIETQRLQSISKRKYDERSVDLAVSQYSEDLAKIIQAKLAEYATLSQSLDHSFPNRLLKIAGNPGTTVEELRKRLFDLELKRERLVSTGLLDKEAELDLSLFSQVSPSNLQVLSVYIKDVDAKLAVLDGLASQIETLKDIINSRFLNKSIIFDKKSGFSFRTSSDIPLAPKHLSSGEQHEIVLLYELLFKVKPETLILIDEPELSLHVEWQQQFLSDIKRVTSLSGIDVLLATHSPMIIHDHWELSVDLGMSSNYASPSLAQ